MTISKTLLLAVFTVAFTLILSADFSLYGQGRGGGRGGGGGRPAGVGNSGMGGVDRGLGNASTRSNGRSDDGWGTASDRSNGRRDTGIDRARAQSANRDRALRNAPDSNELNRYRGISKKLGTTPEALRAQYIAAATLNPDLKFGQFVSANVVADNLHSRFPNVTTSSILTRMADGDSLGQALKVLRVDGTTARRAQKDAEQRIKASMPRE
jgi:hypothetical protein